MNPSMANRMGWILARTRGPHVLNVGCAGYVPDPRSPHWVHGRLCDSFPDVAGIDYDGKIVADLSALGYAHVYHENAESFHMLERFNTIVAGELLEHLCNPGLFLQRVKEHLVPGGTLLLTTPYAFALVHFLYALFHFPHTCSNREHTGWFCVDTLLRLARLNGFRVTHWELLDDYLVIAGATRYRLFVGWLSLVRHLVPLRLRANTLVLELTIEDPPRP